MSTRTDPAIEFYNPAANGYDLAKDPRCLFGWGPPWRNCNHRFGHMCCRELGHPGVCDDRTEFDQTSCMTTTRPKNWDVWGRSEANR